ncbi:HU family DNA-binding protein [Deinococcus sp. MIMF12]|uniref:HU family DNA-binding protein n=2 Tax=Deinococcus rhizophilus TaxID=3049544 RepID=A0ABT7JME6_9DEIO|nr:HU family DNA-binding protein [Deinococcus rhizophilus]MDL2345603.1 HU family DNA-binding protein [Deinococcus rhizophilus]
MLHAMTKKTTKATASKKSEGTASRGANGGATRGRSTSTESGDRSGKVAKTQLVEQVAEKTGLTKKQSEEAVSAMLDVVVDAIRGGQSVGLPGLGTLSVKATAARTGVRPGTSEKIQIPAGKKVAFKVASTLKGNL